MKAILRFAAFALTGASLLGACRSKDEPAPGDSTAKANADAGSLEGPTRKDSARGMAGMPDMSAGQTGSTMGAGMMDSIQTHMRMMDSMSAGEMTAMLGMHRQMVANMLSRMNSEMRQMNMRADATWNATIDSVRQELVHMPDLSARELKAMIPAHHARITRLVQMHQHMMGQMRGTKR